jgi:anti-sigma regulatory factor (Ser/Thr protein kinase)
MHQALFYRDDEGYLDGVMRFVAPALEAGEPVAAAVPPSRAELLRRWLNGSSAQVEILDMFELGRNPARIIPAVEGMLAKHGGRLLHYIGEPIWPGRSDEEIREATKHEALINVAWPGARIRVLCPYNAAELHEDVLADAERTHPSVIFGREPLSSPAYTGSAVPDDCDQALPEPPAGAVALPFGLDDLSQLRALVGARARAAGLPDRRADDLVLAVNELATNAIRHGDGGGLLRVWIAPGELVCQVDDHGHITDPLAGRHMPVPEVAGGVGLWTVNQLCDLVEVRSNRDGTSVRVHSTLD